jgi:hypothetical protein
MNSQTLSKLLTTGAIATALAVTMAISAPHRACAQDSGTAIADSKSPPAQMAGTWIGNLDDTKNGAATLTLDLTQTTATVGGTFSIVFTNSPDTPSGSLHGKVTKSKASLVLTTTNQSHVCKVGMKGEVAPIDEFKGKYKALNPSKHCQAKGTFDLFLQP